jgi:hypothetical protein
MVMVYPYSGGMWMEIKKEDEKEGSDKGKRRDV